jgi:hypothetical protein
MGRRFKLRPKFNKKYKRYILNVPGTISKTGNRQRLFYETLDEAEAAASRLKKRHAQFGVSLKSLTVPRMGEASEVYKLLDAHSKATGDDTTLMQITKEYLSRYKQRNQSISLDDLFCEYWESKEHLSKVHRKQLLYARNRFRTVPALSKKSVSDIDPTEIEEVLSDMSAGTSAMINSGKTIDETILALGHKGNPTMLWNHYYLAIPKEQAMAYWQIVPPVH